MPEETTAIVTAEKKTATLRELLEGDAFKQQVAKALPRHLTPDRFLRVASTALMRTPGLKKCDQVSFFNALLTLSQLGLEPDGRNAHLIPFNNTKRNVVECQLIVDYKGLVDLANRSGTVANIHADKVCENDVFEFDRGEIKKHLIDFKQPRGKAYAYYALVRFKDGSEKCEVMPREDVDAIRSRSRAGKSGPWVTDYDEMAKKTCFRRLSKWIQLSPEFREALEHDADKIEDRRFESARHVEVLSEPIDPFEAVTEAEVQIEDANPSGEILESDQSSPQKRLIQALADSDIKEAAFMKAAGVGGKMITELSDSQASALITEFSDIAEKLK